MITLPNVFSGSSDRFFNRLNLGSLEIFTSATSLTVREKNSDSKKEIYERCIKDITEIMAIKPYNKKEHTGSSNKN